LSPTGGLKDILLDQLRRDQRGVNAEDSPRLPFLLLPVTVCQALGGNYRQAVPAAAANQLFMAAGDILDDIEDDDSQKSLAVRIGRPLALNAATTLIFLAEKILACPTRGVDLAKQNRVAAAANSWYLKASQGQHLDLQKPLVRRLSESGYLKIARLKSASAIQNACVMGALLAGAGRPKIAAMSRFGAGLGLSAQMQNDLRGVVSKQDILAGKITFPVIYALQQADSGSRRRLRRYYMENNPDRLAPTVIFTLLSECGAILYTSIKAEYFKQVAAEAVAGFRGALLETKDLELLVK